MAHCLAVRYSQGAPVFEGSISKIGFLRVAGEVARKRFYADDDETVEERVRVLRRKLKERAHKLEKKGGERRDIFGCYLWGLHEVSAGR